MYKLCSMLMAYMSGKGIEWELLHEICFNGKLFKSMKTNYTIVIVLFKSFTPMFYEEQCYVFQHQALYSLNLAQCDSIIIYSAAHHQNGASGDRSIHVKE